MHTPSREYSSPSWHPSEMETSPALRGIIPNLNHAGLGFTPDSQWLLETKSKATGAEQLSGARQLQAGQSAWGNSRTPQTQIKTQASTRLMHWASKGSRKAGGGIRTCATGDIIPTNHI